MLQTNNWTRNVSYSSTYSWLRNAPFSPFRGHWQLLYTYVFLCFSITFACNRFSTNKFRHSNYFWRAFQPWAVLMGNTNSNIWLERHGEAEKEITQYSSETTIIKASRSQTHTHTHTHIWYDSSGRVISPIQRTLTIHCTHKTSITSMGFEPAVPAMQQPQIQALDTEIPIIFAKLY